MDLLIVCYFTFSARRWDLKSKKIYIIIKYFNKYSFDKKKGKDIESENKEKLMVNMDNENKKANRNIQQPQIKVFSCFSCGHPYKAYPPDSSFMFAYLSPCSETNNLKSNHNHKQPYECINCTHRNYLYWCQGHYNSL